MVCDLIFIFFQLIVFFQSPCQGSGIENTNWLDKNHITSQTMGDPIFIYAP
jgi:hypothetical protein